jgi:hypothetical protein
VPGFADDVLRGRTPELVLVFVRPDLTGPDAILHELEVHREGDATWVRRRRDVIVFVVREIDAGTLLALKG